MRLLPLNFMIQTISSVPIPLMSLEDTPYNRCMLKFSPNYFQRGSFSKALSIPVDYESIKKFVKKVSLKEDISFADSMYRFFKLCLEAGPREKLFRYSATENDFTTKDLDQRGFSFPCSFLGLISEKGIHVYSTLKKSVFLGKGSYKTVIAGLEAFVLHENIPNFSQPFMRPCAISTVEGSYSVKTVKTGIAIQESILSIPGAEQYFVKPPYLKMSFGLRQMQMVSSYDHSSLDKAIFSQSIQEIPERLGGLEAIALDTSDFIRFCKKIVDGVEFLGKNGFFHKDIKLENIFLKIEPNGQVNPYIADFDLATQKSIHNTVDRSFHYWNKACQIGYASIETDLFGLVLTIAETLLLGENRVSYVDNKKFYQDVLFNKEATKACKWVLHKGSLTKDAFDKVFDLLEKMLRADYLSGVFLNEQIQKAERLSTLPLNSIERYKEGTLSLKDKDDYLHFLEEEALKSFEQYPFPIIAEIKSILDACEVEVFK